MSNPNTKSDDKPVSAEVCGECGLPRFTDSDTPWCWMRGSASCLQKVVVKLRAEIESQRIDLLAADAAGQFLDAEMRKRRELIDTLTQNAKLFQADFDLQVARVKELESDVEALRARVAELETQPCIIRQSSTVAYLRDGVRITIERGKSTNGPRLSVSVPVVKTLPLRMKAPQPDRLSCFLCDRTDEHEHSQLPSPPSNPDTTATKEQP